MSGAAEHRDFIPEAEARNLNRRSWDERALVHGQDPLYYDTERFLAGGSTLRDLDVELAGDVNGRDLLHLQCHFGLDSLSWARRGARVTGVDFSLVAIGRARELARRTGLAADFVTADVLDLPADLAGSFDVVWASYGVFTWIGDLRAWARSAERALRPGGRLAVVDLHPLARMIEQRSPLVVDAPYAYDGPHRYSSAASYAAPDRPLENRDTIQWSHSLGELVSAFAAAGLRTDSLEEHLTSERNDRDGVLTQGADGLWRLQLWEYPLPVLFSICATKP
ncbi:class I SAM-dependent methyltransferase [Streptomyces sp. BHT-5-2]|uniref:class I SAM-dependent methyltransferase n=1 Tax=Streptomyces sp. BHT-5-2 TaxID=2866715 RepID=UPI001C8E0DFF|nr:class I SAM-dependent methyltransferase [Streptomyces sp. BHT-5-2]QZL04674.1 class I SAM-dependent methyltransferase [Streptomyces sp. BHT-5-2]